MERRDFDGVVKCFDLFSYISYTAEGGVYRAQAILGDFVIKLLDEFGFDNSFEGEARDEIIKKIRTLSEELYVIWPKNSLNDKCTLAWVFDLICKLYFEAHSLINQFLENSNKRIIFSSVIPYGSEELCIFCWYENLSAPRVRVISSKNILPPPIS